jgi:predicted Fe-S protein YdhL (DUF1289 family)
MDKNHRFTELSAVTIVMTQFLEASEKLRTMTIEEKTAIIRQNLETVTITDPLGIKQDCRLVLEEIFVWNSLSKEEQIVVGDLLKDITDDAEYQKAHAEYMKDEEDFASLLNNSKNTSNQNKYGCS